jgi:hypothetical protein
MEHRIDAPGREVYFWVNGNPTVTMKQCKKAGTLSRLIFLADTIIVFATLLFETQPTLTCRAVSFPN